MSATEQRLPRRFNVLRAIAENPNASTGDIARKTGLVKPAVSMAARILEAAGLVTREANIHDRRLVKLRVTEAGAKAAQERPL